MTLIPLTILVPLIAAGVLTAVRPVSNRTVADLVALVASLAVLVLCAILVHRAWHHDLVYWFGGWRPYHGVALGISFAFGVLGAGFATFCSALMIAALVFSWRFMEDVNALFHVVLLVFLAAMVGFCLSGDLFNMFVFFELMGAAAFVLAGFMIDKRAPLEGSFNFAVTNSIGGIVVLLGISLVYGRTGALNLAQIGVALDRGYADALVAVAFALIVCGFLVKAAIVPFHFWLADAYAVAPTPVCILFAGAMSELGLFGIARVYWTMFHGVLGPHDVGLRAILVVVGLLTGLLGAVLALAQRHLKRLLAFATISYVGLFMIGVAMLTPDGLAGSAAYIVGDGFVKASLFVAVGIAQYRLAGVEEAQLHGHGQRLWFQAAIFALGGLAIAGCPPFGPFLGHALVEDAAARQAGYGWIPAAMLVISAMTGAAVLRTGARVFLELGPPPKQAEPGHEGDEDSEVETDAAHAATPALLVLPAAALLVAGLAWGLIPGLTHSLMAAAARFTDHSGYARTVLSGLPATPAVPATSGPSGAAYLYGVGAMLAAVALGALALYVDRLPRPASRALAGLRALHSGRIGDYVAWLSVGVATIGGAFALTLR
jgi:multicomponent Na+:H+ antiporter subunit D